MRGRRYWNPNPNRRRWRADYPVVNLGDDPVDSYLYNAVGGSTIGYGAQYWRFAPLGLPHPQLDGIGVDWPIAYDDLAPVLPHERARPRHVRDERRSDRPPPRRELPTPPVALGRLGRMWAEAFHKLGWYWWTQELGDLDAPMGGRPKACINRGFCAYGCPELVARHRRRTYWPLRSRAASSCGRTPACARSSSTSDGRASGALYYDDDGDLHEVRARSS